MKIVLVTGASRGIGRQIAVNLSENGYIVIGTYNNTFTQDDECGINYFKCDVSDYAQVEKLFEYIEKNFSKIDGVINCAGISYVGLLQDMSEGEINRIIQTNLSGSIYVTQKAAQMMVKRHSGNIINISSVWGSSGAACEAVYSAAKGGINAFTKAMAKELAPSGIRVNCICPGVIKTDMLSCFSDDDIQQLKEETPLARIGMPQDIADTAQFLLSDKSSFITGQIITVDGGFTL